MNASKRVDFIKNWIIDYIQSMPKKASALVVGVSGGIDSAVVSTISSMTGLKTFVLSMPIKQIKTQDDLSKLHCKWLVSNFKNVSYLNIDLDINILITNLQHLLKLFIKNFRIRKKNLRTYNTLILK